jgi:CRP-like cAMP-binding protein
MFGWLKDYLFDPEFARKRKFLQQVSFFQHVPRHELGRLFQSLSLRTYNAGEVIFKEGDPGRALFILEWGQIEISRKITETQNETLAVLAPGDYFGEMSLMDHMPRTATAAAITASRVYLLYKTELEGLFRRAPQAGAAIMAHLAEMLAARLRDTMQRQYIPGPIVARVDHIIS